MWQTIDTAPDKPMGVLLWVPEGDLGPDLVYGQDYRIEIGFWNGSGFYEQGTSHWLGERRYPEPDHYPTHWMPLPPPPTDNKE